MKKLKPKSPAKPKKPLEVVCTPAPRTYSSILEMTASAIKTKMLSGEVKQIPLQVVPIQGVGWRAFVVAEPVIVFTYGMTQELAMQKLRQSAGYQYIQEYINT